MASRLGTPAYKTQELHHPKHNAEGKGLGTVCKTAMASMCPNTAVSTEARRDWGTGLTQGYE